MKIGIITVTHNSLLSLINLVNSMAEYVYPRYPTLTHYVIDNKSSNTEYENMRTLAESFTALRLDRYNTNMLYTQANNFAIEKAISEKCDRIFIINPDIIIKENIFPALLERLDNKRTGAVGIKLKYPGTNIIEHAGCVENKHLGYGEEDTGEYENPRLVEWITGAFIGFRSDIIEKCGYLDSGFPHWVSDQEFCRRVKLFDYDIVYLPVTAFHDQGKSSSVERHYGTIHDTVPGVFPNIFPYSLSYIKERAFYNYMIQRLVNTENEAAFREEIQDINEIIAKVKPFIMT